MIKGRYVAQIEIDFSYMSGARPQSESGLNTFRERLGDVWMEKAIKHYLRKIFQGGETDIKVTRQLSDIYETEGNNDETR